MKDITDTLKKTAIGLGILALMGCTPLNVQKTVDNYYCFPKKTYNIEKYKNLSSMNQEHNYCLSTMSKKTKRAKESKPCPLKKNSYYRK